MNTLGNRIRNLREAMHPSVSQRALGELCGWEGKSAQARIGNYENNVREPSIDDLKKIATALGTTAAYLIGEIETPISAGESIGQYAVVPQYTAIGSAGSGYENGHVEVKGGLVFKTEWLKKMGLKPEKLRVIYAEGMSMEPTIVDGDVLLMDESQTTPVSGKVYALCRPDGQISIKRLFQSHTRGWVISSDNLNKSRFPDEEATDSDIGHLRIEGRIVWHAGEL